jgi:hypothetical protein
VVECLLEAYNRYLILVESMEMVIYHIKIIVGPAWVKSSWIPQRHIGWLEAPQIKSDNPSLTRNIGDIFLIIPFEYLSRRSFAEPGKYAEDAYDSTPAAAKNVVGELDVRAALPGITIRHARHASTKCMISWTVLDHVLARAKNSRVGENGAILRLRVPQSYHKQFSNSNL